METFEGVAFKHLNNAILIDPQILTGKFSCGLKPICKICDPSEKLTIRYTNKASPHYTLLLIFTCLHQIHTKA